ncbi:MAG: two-component sensor histidine kinase [Paludibacterium sp.]|uniref:ATP-binding protein n=1 Tax=Paludibacterium sp. TaxID=1917523 RepID=UPI0025E69F29|nr:ATP-binding protein [Paludibacterium sp.]MBV8045598.1 two-component sensor histidine kinase [Paludibacterium sp.]MBV8647952.1 two-component sensor histidine kinase [Paludibacterium sp.]
MRQRFLGLLRPTLATLFFRYYLSALLALVLIISAVGVVIDQIYTGVDEDNARSFMRGAVLTFEQTLQNEPEQRWAAALPKLAAGYSYHIALTDLKHLQALDDGQRQDIQRGVMRFDEDSNLLYARVGDSQQVLVFGPLNFAVPDSDSLLTDGTHAKALWWTLTGLGFGLLVFLFIRPLWNDLVAIRETAEKLAAGELSARAPRAKSWILTPLSAGLNTMAERLEGQMNAHQTLSHAVSHELRTPIARLRFGLTMLEEAENEQEREKYRVGMEHDMQELDDLVNASMSYAQLDQGQIILQREHTELAEWFADLLGLIRPLAPAGVKLALDCPQSDAEFDRKLMYIATRNLLVNAVRFAATLVRLQVGKQDGWLSVVVDDDGPGVPLEERERIFEPFHRLDNGRERNSSSYGLGLSFVRLIAEQHGGSVFVTDSPEGGARFVLNIPEQGSGDEAS